MVFVCWLFVFGLSASTCCIALVAYDFIIILYCGITGMQLAVKIVSTFMFILTFISIGAFFSIASQVVFFCFLLHYLFITNLF